MNTWNDHCNEHRAYDYLPLIIQADHQGNPELFELPLNCAPPVHIFHPKYPELSQLSMQWYVYICFTGLRMYITYSWTYI